MQKFLDTSDGLGKILDNHKTRNILLVTGAHSYEQTGASRKLEPLLRNYNVARFIAATNPKIGEIEQAVLLSRNHHADTIIAVGGGSVIDTAKAAHVLTPQEGNLEEIVKNNAAPKDPEALFIAIPTTAGSGAESTHFAVIYINKQKYSLSHPQALANIVVLDSSLTYSLPPHVTATTGMDAIAQAIEAYWSIKSTDKSRSCSRRALEKLLPNLEKSVHDPTPASRKAVLEGANLAGQAINIAMTTGPHAISYGFTANYNLAHGEAVSLTLPLFMVFNSRVTEKNCQDPRGISFAKARIDEIVKMLGEPSATKASKKLEILATSIGLQRTLKAQDPLHAKALLSRSVGKDRLRNNPRLIASNDIKAILEKVVR